MWKSDSNNNNNASCGYTIILRCAFKSCPEFELFNGASNSSNIVINSNNNRGSNNSYIVGFVCWDIFDISIQTEINSEVTSWTTPTTSFPWNGRHATNAARSTTIAAGSTKCNASSTKVRTYVIGHMLILLRCMKSNLQKFTMFRKISLSILIKQMIEMLVSGTDCSGRMVVSSNFKQKVDPIWVQITRIKVLVRDGCALTCVFVFVVFPLKLTDTVTRATLSVLSYCFHFWSSGTITEAEIK